MINVNRKMFDKTAKLFQFKPKAKAVMCNV